MTKYFKRPNLRLNVYGVLSYYSGFGRSDDDFVDRLSRQYSVLIFLAFILIVSSVQFVGKPISCFPPASFTSAHVTYADFVCWISGTYFISMDAGIPEPVDLSETRPGTKILRFYQYVPFILMFQTLGFFLPGFFWRCGSARLGYSIQKHLNLLKLNRRSYTESPLHRRQTIRTVAQRLDQYFRYKPRAFFPRLTILYVSMKIFYLINIVLQLFSLNYLMNFDWNFQVLAQRFRIYSNPIENASLQFPTNVLCDFIVRFLGKNKHRHTIQCVLPINIFNEKIFIFAFFWLVFLLILTSYNLLVDWILFLVFHRKLIDTRQRRHRYVSSRFYDDSDDETEIVRTFRLQTINENFSRNYLKSDGLLILRLFDLNTDLVTMNDLIDALWDFYQLDPM